MDAVTTAGVAGSVDGMGMAGSGLCALHCAVGPSAAALAGLGPMAGRLDALVHPLFAAVLIPLTLAAMQDGAPRVRTLLGVGALFVLSALVVHDLTGATAGTGLTLAGSGLMMMGHRENRMRSPRHDA